MTTTPPPDEFDALKAIATALEPFEKEPQARLLRWVSEKLGITQTSPLPPAASGTHPGSPPPTPPATPHTAKDIKTFAALKNPKSDVQFAAAVAYFNRFEANENEKKESITKDDLIEAYRRAGRARPKSPNDTLQNAVKSGLLDNVGRGAFSINSVGENLVAVTLPGDGNTGDLSGQARRRRAKKAAKKTPARKK